MALIVDGWLLTEAVRLAEEQRGRFADDAAANAVARATPGDFARRLEARARALPDAKAAREDIRRLRHLATAINLALLAAGALGGWAAAQAALAARQVDALLALAALLGLPTAMLALWLVMFIGSGRAGRGGPGLGALFTTALGWIAPRLLHSPLAPELVRAAGRLTLTRPGRWLLGAVSHGLWLAYTAAAVLAMAVSFSLVQYQLTWGTTILDPQTVVAVVGALAWLPGALHLLPDAGPDWILAAREGTPTGASRVAWAQFLLASVALYGALPRLLLAGLCGGLARYHARRLRLDAHLPGYLRLREVLAAPAAPDAEAAPASAAPASAARARAADAAGPALLITVELEADADTPGIPGVEAPLIGTLDTRTARRQVTSALGALERPPPALIAVCSLLRTPDAGTAAALDAAADVARAPLLLVLDEGARLTARGGDAAARQADWRRLARSIGAGCVVLDRAAPDAAAIATLRRWLAAGERTP